MAEAGEQLVAFPAALTELAQVQFDFGDDYDVDFDPGDQFEDPAETAAWFREWTGNDAADARPLLVFGRDFSGGLVGFWQEHVGGDITEQPVVFLGSEGQTGVVALNLSGFLWLVADGWGPAEAVFYRENDPPEEDEAGASMRFAHPNPAVAAIAVRHAVPPRRTAAEVTAAALPASIRFEQMIEALCR
jgi:hypothetical protein